MSLTLRRHVQAHDPYLINLRKAVRAAIVCPLVLVIGLGVLDNSYLALFGFFGSFVAVVFADYGGPPGARTLGYLGLMVVGSVLIIVGTALSNSLVAGILGMFAIVSVLVFTTVYGGYAGASMPSLALAISLAILVPWDEAALSDRVLGWVFGTGLSLVAALTMFPIERRIGIRQSLADVADQLVAVLRADDVADASTRAATAAEQMTSLRASVATTPLRPAGPAARDIGFMRLLDHMEYSVQLARETLAGGVAVLAHPVAAATADALSAIAGLLRGTGEPAHVVGTVEALDQVRDAAINDATSADSGPTRLTRLRRQEPLLALSHVTLWMANEAAIAVKARPAVSSELRSAPEIAVVTSILGGRVQRAVWLARRELSFRSVYLRNSIRGGAALTVAFVLADLLPVEHGFWVVLAALMVLRTSAGATNNTAINALVGTLVGFGVAAVIVLVFGGSEIAMWTLLPFAVFFGALLPGTVGLAAGQAGFAVLVVVLFDLLEPVGIDTGVVRLETVGLGVIAAVAMGWVFWPQGARPVLAEALAEAYRSAAAGLRFGAAYRSDDRSATRLRIRLARRHADVVFGAALGEPGKGIDGPMWVGLFRPANLAIALFEGQVPAPSDPLPARCERAWNMVTDQVGEVCAHFDQLADQLQEPTAAPLAVPDRAHVDDATFCRCLEEGERARDALYVVAWSDFLRRLDRDLDAIAPAVARVAVVSRQHRLASAEPAQPSDARDRATSSPPA